MSRGCCNTYRNMPIAIGVLMRQWHHRVYAGVVINTSVGSCVARFDRHGQFSGASNRGASKMQSFTLFFMPVYKVFLQINLK